MAINGWWIVFTILVVIIVAQGFAYRRLKTRWRQEINETTRLNRKLSDTRRELAEINTRRKKLLAAATQALIIVESNFTISSANRVAKRLFGKHPKGSSLMTWTRQHQLQELVERTLAGEKLPPMYITWNDHHLEAQARVIKQNKEPVAVALAVHDVTELDHLTIVAYRIVEEKLMGLRAIHQHIPIIPTRRHNTKRLQQFILVHVLSDKSRLITFSLKPGCDRRSIVKLRRATIGRAIGKHRMIVRVLAR